MILRLSENAHLPFGRLMALSKVEGPFGRLTALSKVEGLRYPHPSSLRRTSLYASFLEICPRYAWTPHPAGVSPVSEALHMDIFHQPLRNMFFGSLLGSLNSALISVCVVIGQNRHSGRALEAGTYSALGWARPGIQENRGRLKYSGSRLASRSAGLGRDDELRHSLLREGL